MNSFYLAYPWVKRIAQFEKAKRISCLGNRSARSRNRHCSLAITEAADGHSNSFFLILPRTLAYLKIPINDPVDEYNFSFLIPILACAPFLGFSCYLINAERE